MATFLEPEFNAAEFHNIFVCGRESHLSSILSWGPYHIVDSDSVNLAKGLNVCIPSKITSDAATDGLKTTH